MTVTDNESWFSILKEGKKKRKKKHGCGAQRFSEIYLFFSLLNIPTSATLLFSPKSLSSFLCRVRPDWSGVIDEEHRFGRALITLLVIRTSWINDRREGEGYRALEFRTKPLWRGREDKGREGKVRTSEEVKKAVWGDNRTSVTEMGKVKQKENCFVVLMPYTNVFFWHVRQKQRQSPHMTRWRKLFYSVYAALNIKNVKSKVFIAALFCRKECS